MYAFQCINVWWSIFYEIRDWTDCNSPQHPDWAPNKIVYYTSFKAIYNIGLEECGYRHIVNRVQDDTCPFACDNRFTIIS